MPVSGLGGTSRRVGLSTTGWLVVGGVAAVGLWLLWWRRVGQAPRTGLTVKTGAPMLPQPTMLELARRGTPTGMLRDIGRQAQDPFEVFARDVTRGFEGVGGCFAASRGLGSLG